MWFDLIVNLCRCTVHCWHLCKLWLWLVVS